MFFYFLTKFFNQLPLHLFQQFLKCPVKIDITFSSEGEKERERGRITCLCDFGRFKIRIYFRPFTQFFKCCPECFWCWEQLKGILWRRIYSTVGIVLSSFQCIMAIVCAFFLSTEFESRSLQWACYRKQEFKVTSFTNNVKAGHRIFSRKVTFPHNEMRKALYQNSGQIMEANRGLVAITHFK